MPDLAAAGWSLAVDREVCIGSGLCVTYAPGTFTQDEQAKVLLVSPSTDDLDTVRIAVDACPTYAIQLNGADA